MECLDPQAKSFNIFQSAALYKFIQYTNIQFSIGHYFFHHFFTRVRSVSVARFGALFRVFISVFQPMISAHNTILDFALAQQHS